MLLSDAELAEARAVAASTLDAIVAILGGNDDTGGGWDPETGPTDPTGPVVVWEGPGRVQATRSNPNATEAAGQPVTVRAYRVSLPWDAPAPAVGARIRVIEHPRDPELVGKVLTVTGIVYGDLAIERVLYTDLDLTNQQ